MFTLTLALSLKPCVFTWSHPSPTILIPETHNTYPSHLEFVGNIYLEGLRAPTRDAPTCEMSCS